MARTSKFKVGDLVTLKSGGPPMTVNMLFEDGGVQTVWHLEDGNLRREGFYPGALKMRRNEARSTGGTK